jgi:hypothetical protein
MKNLMPLNTKTMPNANDMNCNIVVVEITVVSPKVRSTLGAREIKYVTPVAMATPRARYRNPSIYRLIDPLNQDLQALLLRLRHAILLSPNHII